MIFLYIYSVVDLIESGRCRKDDAKTLRPNNITYGRI